jgi:Rha family phage regulatory protein
MPTTENQKGRGADTLTTPTPGSADIALVHIRGGELFTNSLAIAREFGRRHDNVLQTLDSLIADGTINHLDFKVVEYIDAKGEKRRMIELDERGGLVVMPFVGGRNARKGQARLVDAFLHMRERLRERYSIARLPEPSLKRSTVADREPLFVLAGKCVARYGWRFTIVYVAMSTYAGSACFRTMDGTQVCAAARFAQHLLDGAVTADEWQRLAANRALLGRESGQLSLFAEAT